MLYRHPVGHFMGMDKIEQLQPRQCEFQFFGVRCADVFKPRTIKHWYCDYHDAPLRARLDAKFGKRPKFKLRNLNNTDRKLLSMTPEQRAQFLENQDFTVEANTDPALYTQQQLQAEIDQWARTNFGITENTAFINDAFNEIDAGRVLYAMMLLGRMAHAILKKAQNIRNNEDHKQTYYEARMALWDLMREAAPVEAIDTFENIVNSDAALKIAQFIGMVEELGETVNEMVRNDRPKLIDGLGDLQVYLTNFCSFNGLSAHQAFIDTWREVRKRNWKKNPDTGQVK